MDKINHAKAFKELLALAFCASLLMRFLAGEVSVPEAFVLSTVVVMIGAYAMLGLYLRRARQQEELAKKLSESSEWTDFVQHTKKDISELQHKMNAETLQKGFRLK